MCVLGLLVAACGGGDGGDTGIEASDVPSGTTALTYSWTADDGSVADREYLLYVPANYAAEESWPLVLYLHGGPGPETIEDTATAGLPALVELLPYRFVMVAPLATVADMTAPIEVGPAWGYGDWPAYLIDLIDHVDESLAIDRDRIYFAGHSRGGHGIWRLALAEPELPAALLAMSSGWGSLDLPPNLCDIAGIPTRVVHGTDDPIVPIADSQAIVAALEACGGEVVFDLLEGVEHETLWTSHRDLQVVDWLLAQGAEEAWPALPDTSTSLENLIEIETRFSPSGATFEVIAGTDALGCERGTVVDDAFEWTGFARSFTCEFGERGGGGFSMYFVPNTNEWTITTGTGGFEGVKASGFAWLTHVDAGLPSREIIAGRIGRIIELPASEETVAADTEREEIDLALADGVFEAWNSLDPAIFVSSLAADATYDLAPADSEAARNEMGFWMGLGGSLDVISCEQAPPDRISCSVSGPDDLSGPEGFGFRSRVELVVDDGEVVAFEWDPTEWGKIEFAMEMVRWVEQAHPDVWESTFSAPGCGFAIDCWDERWTTSPDGARALLELRDEYLASRNG